ncbi:hypothetical protein N8Q82_26925, partial [Enterobacter roggenkampii]|nr:hypothetical protein [Enterobacter roggenkampii]
GGKNSLNRLIRCVCGKKIGPDPRNFNQRVSLGRNDLLIRTFPIQTGDLPSLYEIYGEKGENVKKSVEEVLSMSKLTSVKKLGEIDGLLLRGVIMATERDHDGVYKRHPGNLLLLMPEHKDDEVADGTNLFDTQLYNPIDYSLYDIGVNAGILTSNPYSGLAPIFPYTFYHLTHYWFAAADIPVANDTPVHYADAIRCNVR